MNLTHIVGAFRDGLDSKLLQRHRLHDDLLQGLDGSIHRTVTRSSRLELLTTDIQTYRGYTLHALACRHLQEVETHGTGVRGVGTCQHHHIGIAHLLLLVCQYQELLIDLIQFLIVQIHAVHMQTVLQGSPSAAGCQHDAVVVDTHILRVHDLVGMHILQHAVLMDAAGVCKGVTTHNGLIRLYGHIHQRRHHTTRRIDLRRVDVRVDAETLVTFQDHGDFLKRGITSPFTDTVDRHLHLSGTSHHTVKGIRRCHT